VAERHPVSSHGFAPRGGRFPVRRLARGRGPARVDEGVVTAEFAIALPTVMLVLATLLATATVALNHMRCIDAARAAARAAARNDPAVDVVTIARELGPPKAQVASASQGDRVVVTVSAPVTLRFPGSPTVWVSSSAVAVREVGGEPAQGAGVVSAAALQAAEAIGRRRRRRRRSADRDTDRPGGRPEGRGRRRRDVRRRPPPHPPDVADDVTRGPVREPGQKGKGDRGAGTVLALGLTSVVLGLTAVLSALGHVVSSRHQAAAAADLAALAAAQTAAGTSADGPSTGPCGAAARIASANRGQLTSCSLDPGGTAAVSVRVGTRYGFAVRTTARAGPADAGLP
jgi:secretion/DNA translocation related TadE-like protein